MERRGKLHQFGVSVNTPSPETTAGNSDIFGAKQGALGVQSGFARLTLGSSLAGWLSRLVGMLAFKVERARPLFL